MKFKVDENLPVEVAQILRQANYDATTVHDEYLTGAVDADIATACQTEERIIMRHETS